METDCGCLQKGWLEGLENPTEASHGKAAGASAVHDECAVQVPALIGLTS